MKNLSKQIDKLIKDELLSINPKINELSLLEILKYRIIDRFKSDALKISYKDDKETTLVTNYNHESHNLTNKLILYKAPITNLDFEIEISTLLICLAETMSVGIDDKLLKIKNNIKLIPMTGLVISKGSKCNFKFNKNSIILDLSLKDSADNVEN
tara:strand:- start:192 stop:656 length:465 start_codon:yes stop_codon:yes gene_type:complete